MLYGMFFNITLLCMQILNQCNPNIKWEALKVRLSFHAVVDTSVVAKACVVDCDWPTFHHFQYVVNQSVCHQSQVKITVEKNSRQNTSRCIKCGGILWQERNTRSLLKLTKKLPASLPDKKNTAMKTTRKNV